MRIDSEAAYVQYVSGRIIPLRRTAYRLCGDWQFAEDLVQAALVKLFVRWKRARSAGNLDAYTRQIVVRTWLDETRRPWRRADPVAEVPEAGPDPAYEDPATRLVLVAALATVPPRQRAVVVLRFWEDLSVAETAKVLGCSEGTVKSQSSDGLAALRRALPAEAWADQVDTSQGGAR
jgi:RNA polymerase sigma-70 factor (sigma-E family)